MTDIELDAFEHRLVADLRAYAAAMPVAVDAAAMTDRVASRRRSPWASVAARWPWSVALVSPAARQRMLILVAAAVTVALVGMAIAAGAKLLERDQVPIDVGAWQPTLIAADGGTAQAVTATDGTIWATALDRLVRVDPTSGDVTTWDAGDDPTFLGPTLVPSRAGGVWLVGRRQIRHFDGATLGAPIVPRTRDGAEISSVAEEANGTIDVAAEAGVIHRWRAGTWSDLALPDAQATATGLIADPEGGLWMSLVMYPPGKGAGIAHFDGAGWTVDVASDLGETLPTFDGFVRAGDGTWWAGSSDGVWRLDGTRWARSTDELAGPPWSAALADDGGVWFVSSQVQPTGIARITTDGRIDRIDTEGIHASDDSAWASIGLAVSKGSIVAVTPTGVYRWEGARWARTWPTGDVSVLPPLRLAAISRDEAWGVSTASRPEGETRVWRLSPEGATEVPFDIARESRGDIAVDRLGTPWVATSGGVATFVAGRWQTIGSEAVSAVAVGADDRVWVVQADAVRRVASDGDGFDATLASDGVRDLLPRVFGSSTTIDREGGVWISGGRPFPSGFGLYRWDAGAWQPMTPFTEAYRSLFSSPETAPDGAVWVIVDGTGFTNDCCQGPEPNRLILRYASGGWTAYGVDDGLPDPSTARVTDLAVAPDGAVWVTTWNGIYRFDGTRWRLVIPDTWAANITFAPDGTMWTSGTPGVVRWAPRS